jgi:hypothetical protein
MYSQPLFGNSVDAVYTPAFGGALYGPRPGASQAASCDDYQRTTYASASSACVLAALPIPASNTVLIVRHNYRSPIVTGTSVIAIQYDGGIIMAADTLGMLIALLNHMHCHCIR